MWKDIMSTGWQYMTELTLVKLTSISSSESLSSSSAASTKLDTFFFSFSYKQNAFRFKLNLEKFCPSQFLVLSHYFSAHNQQRSDAVMLPKVLSISLQWTLVLALPVPREGKGAWLGGCKKTEYDISQCIIYFSAFDMFCSTFSFWR